MQEGGRIFEGGGAGGSASRPAQCRAALRRWPGGARTGTREGMLVAVAACSIGFHAQRNEARRWSESWPATSSPARHGSGGAGLRRRGAGIGHAAREARRCPLKGRGQGPRARTPRPAAGGGALAMRLGQIAMGPGGPEAGSGWGAGRSRSSPRARPR
jgi:hypothetical protein